MRCPISPGHGAASSPGMSFWNFTHFTTRPLLLVTGLSLGPGGPPHIAIALSYSRPWREEVVLPVGVDTLVAIRAEVIDDVGPLRLFLIVFDGHGAEAVLVESDAAQRVELRPFDVEAEEMNEGRRLGAVENVGERDRGQFDGRALRRFLFPLPERIGDAAKAGMRMEPHRFS